MATPKQKARQVNIRVKAGDYRRIAAAAKREKTTIAGFVRVSALDRALNGPADGFGVNGVPAWLLSLLLFVFYPARRHTKS